MKAFAQNAQKLIDQKGYTVNISTKLLLGDSAKGKELTDQSNEFYSQLDADMSVLTKRLNKKLSKAMKDGLTPDTQAAIDGILQSMSEITNAISDAEAQANWDILSGKWSGKDLTADNFEELQEQINQLQHGFKIFW